MECYHCNTDVTADEAREPYTLPSGDTTTVHSDCTIPQSPIPRFKTIKVNDQVEFTVRGDNTIKGSVAGMGQTHDPAKGRFRFIEATEWADLPTDQVLLVHEYTQSGWGDVYAYVRDYSATDELGEYEYENLGKISELIVS